MKKGIEVLFKLQKKDDKIKKLEGIISEIPEAIKKLETERDSKATIVENTREKLQENTREREKFEKEIGMIKEKINKYKEQMNKSTTNKEYQGFLAEIKFEENSISTIEEKIIERMVESDEIMEEIRDSEEEFKKISAEYNEEITQLNRELGEHKGQVAETQKDREELRGQAPKNLLKIYDNLAAKKDGIAVSYVETNFCSVCNVKIRPQRLNELISSDDLFICENCGRILFLKFEASKEETTVQ